MAFNGEIVVDVRGIPELVADVRLEMASVLREAAEAEADPRLAWRLVAIAAAFECGQRSEGSNGD